MSSEQTTGTTDGYEGAIEAARRKIAEYEARGGSHLLAQADHLLGLARVNGINVDKDRRALDIHLERLDSRTF